MFTPGQFVYDRQQLADETQEAGVAVVYAVRDESAHDVEIDAVGTTVADYGDNPEYVEAGDRAVDIIFEESLERNFPRWRSVDADGLQAFLHEQRRAWNIPLAPITYTYPEGRLAPADDHEVTNP